MHLIKSLTFKHHVANLLAVVRWSNIYSHSKIKNISLVQLGVIYKFIKRNFLAEANFCRQKSLANM